MKKERNLLKSRFRHPNTGTRYTRQLFHEPMQQYAGKETNTIEPLFTLMHDREGLINFRTEYVNDEDKTGYKTSTRLLEDFDHFQLLMRNCSWFREAKEAWDLEIDARLSQKAVHALNELLASERPADRLSAAKALLALSGGNSKAKPKRGRPSAEEVIGNLKQETAEAKAIQDDLDRISLVVSNKGN